ncbi:SAP domain superfamily [Arabidopsis thaliana x Arabidopsis arenosa]|uniref:SAP domain superfamily n=1 Tax=Arabidopsis thaliana x Arabidopsis arenosa TaxID=1240361 RepID=A0A8T2AN43_9BRAS|nr:SAP domain superfamily [Arabidopsis thaliana x Arabidopsis arenosa]
MSLLFLNPPFPSNSIHPIPRRAVGLSSIRCSISAPEKKPRRRRKQKRGDGAENDSSLSFGSGEAVSALERSLRLTFMDELMERARNRDTSGVTEVIYDMIAAGLSPGPRSFHGLVVAYALNGDEQGAMHSLRKELGAGQRPLPETMIALVRLSGSKGNATRGLEILAAMEKLNYDIRQAWLILVEELMRINHLEDANKVFLKGARGGMRATDQLYDLMIEEDCKAGDHSNALDISYEMEAAGRMATTFHFNCLLSVQATCGIPEVAYATFENMEYGEEFMKPDTETYNWVIQAYTRAESYDRVQDVAELLGMMVEDHKRVQPNVKTYALLVECFTKYCVVKEAIRHFRALKNFEGGTIILHNAGNFEDPLSLYLRALCREGRIVELIDALDAMRKDSQPIPPRAMIMSRKYRTLVSSWIEPLQEEAELGYEIDYLARYIEEGGLTGERKRWVPRRGKTPLDPDASGFIYSNPIETSFKQRCLEDWKIHHRKLLRTLQSEGLPVLGDASESDYMRVMERLRNIIKGPALNLLKPKAASKMVVSELKEELEAQGLPIDGTRNVLYQRVQKARRINKSRGRPLWVPPIEEEEEEVDEEVDNLICRIKLHEGDTEFWKCRFLGEGLIETSVESKETTESVVTGESEKAIEDISKEADNDEDDDEEEQEGDEDDDETEEEEEVVVAETENRAEGEDLVKNKAADAKKHLQMIGVQLLKESDEANRTKKRGKRASRMTLEDDADEDWFPEDPFEAFKEMRERKVFDVSDMYTIADVWGWTWEKDFKNKTPRKWSQEWEVELAIVLMTKVIELGGIPTIGDCAVILRAALRAPMPSAFLKILQTTHSLGYSFGSPLYDEIITLCLDIGELDAAIAIVADMETTGITVPDETLDKVISARQSNENPRSEPEEPPSTVSS